MDTWMLYLILERREIKDTINQFKWVWIVEGKLLQITEFNKSKAMGAHSYHVTKDVWFCFNFVGSISQKKRKKIQIVTVFRKEGITPFSVNLLKHIRFSL